MPKKKPKAKRPKGYAKLSQKEKFIAAAKEFEAAVEQNDEGPQACKRPSKWMVF